MLNMEARKRVDEWLDGNQVCDECYGTLYGLLLVKAPTKPIQPVNQHAGECAVCRARL